MTAPMTFAEFIADHVAVGSTLIGQATPRLQNLCALLASASATQPLPAIESMQDLVSWVIMQLGSDYEHAAAAVWFEFELHRDSRAWDEAAAASAELAIAAALELARVTRIAAHARPPVDREHPMQQMGVNEALGLLSHAVSTVVAADGAGEGGNPEGLILALHLAHIDLTRVAAAFIAPRYARLAAVREKETTNPTTH